jgi:hypothetical protein
LSSTFSSAEVVRSFVVCSSFIFTKSNFRPISLRACSANLRGEVRQPKLEWALYLIKS